MGHFLLASFTLATLPVAASLENNWLNTLRTSCILERVQISNNATSRGGAEWFKVSSGQTSKCVVWR